MAKKKHPGGRPIELKGATVINYRVDAETVEAIEKLTACWDCSKSEAVRKAIKDAAEKATMKKEGPSE